MRCVVNFSGGPASALSAVFAVEEFGRGNVTLLFADTLIEDEDLYRFNRDVSAHLGVPITRIAEGRTPWEVFFSERMMGNSQADHCSRILKREMLDAWCAANASPETHIQFVGMDANEAHRLDGMQRRVAPWRVRSPLIERGLFKEQVIGRIQALGLRIPKLNALGFPHNNCGGFCIKAGQGHFKKLLAELPDVFDMNAAKEEAFRRFTGKDVAILRDRSGGTTKPLPLRQLQARIAADAASVDDFDLGGCGCMSPVELTFEEVFEA